MAYFNQLQGYMSNLQEGINHENDVKQEYGEQKATTIEDKFNAISQQAEGWGGALTGAGTVWKHGRKVFRTLQSQGQAATDATTNSVADGATNDVVQAANNAVSNFSNVAANFSNGINSITNTGNVANALASSLPSTVIPSSIVPAGSSAAAASGAGAGAAAAPLPAAPLSSAQTLAANYSATNTLSVARGGVVQGGIQGGGSSGVNVGNAMNQHLATGQSAGQTSGSATGGAPPAPLQNPQATQQNLAGGQQTQTPNPPTSQQNPANPASQQTPNPNPNGNPNGRNVGDDGLGGDADDAVSNVASKVMGGMDAALDGIPVIGEIIGIGSLIGGLIHGLDKKGEEAKATAASSQTGTVGGGIDTSVFKGNTLGAGGGGYIA